MIEGDLLFEQTEAAITVCLIIILFGVIAMAIGLMLVKRMIGVEQSCEQEINLKIEEVL